MKKKILIISFWIHPDITPRAFRATELAKQFSLQGHEVTLYGALLNNYDYSNFEKENGIKVKEIKNLRFIKKVNNGGEDTRSFILKVFSRLFGKLLSFPMIELTFRLPSLIKDEGKVDLLVTIANPHEIHWGAALSKYLRHKRFPKKWIADCGDPFMGNKFIHHYWYFKYIEKFYCNKCDYITIPTEDAIEAYYHEFRGKIRIIPQGFVFPNEILLENNPINKIPTFLYAGSVYKDNRDPTEFMEYLITLNFDFRFYVYTDKPSFFSPYKDSLGLKLIVNQFIPRADILIEYSKMDFLINFENHTSIQVPSKLIDYYISGRPILSLPNDILPIDLINEFFEGNYRARYIIDDIEQYDIRNVAHKMLLL